MMDWPHTRQSAYSRGLAQQRLVRERAFISETAWLDSQVDR